MAKRSRTRKDRVLHEGEHVDGMDPPNQNFPLEITPNDKWPLSRLMRPPEEGEEQRLVGVFVDPSLGLDHPMEWATNPPTWMDPHLFLKLAKKDVDVRRALKRAFDKNSPDTRAVEQAFQSIFDEHYLPRIMDWFERYASPVLAQWMLNSYAQVKLDHQSGSRNKK